MGLIFFINNYIKNNNFNEFNNFIKNNDNKNILVIIDKQIKKVKYYKSNKKKKNYYKILFNLKDIIKNKIKEDIFCKICFIEEEKISLNCCINKICITCHNKLNKCPWCRTEFININVVNTFLNNNLCNLCNENVISDDRLFCLICTAQFFNYNINDDLIEDNFINNLD